MTYMATMGDDHVVPNFNHRIRKKLLGTDVRVPDAMHVGKALDRWQPRPAVVGACDAEGRPHGTRAIVGAAAVELDVIKARPEFIHQGWADSACPVQC